MFDTVLCGAEFSDAMAAGHVARIYDWYEYEAEQIGYSFVEALVRERTLCRSAGHKTGELFCKLLLNALVGKFGQQGAEWVDAPEEWPATLWGSWLRYNRDLDENVILRALGGRVQRQKEKAETDNSCPAIAAAVVAQARVYMRRYRELIGPRHVYYQDTDSLHCSGARLNEVASQIPADPIKPGYFKLQTLWRRATYMGKKVYRLDRSWTVAGIKAAAEQQPGAVWKQWMVDGIANVLHRGPHRGLRSREVLRRLRTGDCGGRVSESGWVEPYELRAAD